MNRMIKSTKLKQSDLAWRVPAGQPVVAEGLTWICGDPWEPGGLEPRIIKPVGILTAQPGGDRG